MKALTRPRAVALTVVVLAMGASGWWPVLAQPGYETALLAGLVVPACSAVATAWELRRVRWGGFALLARATQTGVLLALAAYLVTLAHGLAAGLCDLQAGSLLFALGPGVGGVLGFGERTG